MQKSAEPNKEHPGTRGQSAGNLFAFWPVSAVGEKNGKEKEQAND